MGKIIFKTNVQKDKKIAHMRFTSSSSIHRNIIKMYTI